MAVRVCAYVWMRSLDESNEAGGGKAAAEAAARSAQIRRRRRWSAGFEAQQHTCAVPPCCTAARLPSHPWNEGAVTHYTLRLPCTHSLTCTCLLEAREGQSALQQITASVFGSTGGFVCIENVVYVSNVWFCLRWCAGGYMKVERVRPMLRVLRDRAPAAQSESSAAACTSSATTQPPSANPHTT